MATLTYPSILVAPQDDDQYQPISLPPGGLLATTVGTPTQPAPPVAPSEQPSPYTMEADSAVDKLNQITGTASPYMQRARAEGLSVANKRGLLNSSIAAGASAGAAIDRAAPLAIADAQAAQQRNAIRLGAQFEDIRQIRGIKSQEEMQRDEIASRERMLGRQLTSEEARAAQADATSRWQSQLSATTQKDIATMDISSREAITSREIASREAMLGRQLTADEAAQIRDLTSRSLLQEAQIQAESERLGRQLTAAEQQQIRELVSREALTREGFQVDLQRLGITEAGQLQRLTISEENENTRANLSAATAIQQQTLANASDAQKATLAYFADMNRIFQASLDNLYQNKDMPAPARDAAIQYFTALRNASIDIPAAVFGTSLNWGTGTQPVTETGGFVPQAPASTTLAPSPASIIPQNQMDYLGGLAGTYDRGVSYA